MPLDTGIPQPSTSCSCPTLTVPTFFLSFLTILGTACVITALVRVALYLHRSRTKPKRNESKAGESEQEDLDKQYGQRFNKLIIEMKAVIEIGDSPPIAESYWLGFGAKERVLFCFKHLDRLTEDGSLPRHEELGSRTGLRLVDVLDGVEP